MENDGGQPSRLMEYLPAVYYGFDDSEQSPLLNNFLLAFEKVLLGRKDAPVSKRHAESKSAEEAESRFESLEEEVNDLHRLFEPDNTPARFLAWLAGWAALSLDARLSVQRRRSLIARIIPLYRIRGTKAYLEELLKLHLEAGITIAVEDVERPHLQVGQSSTIGKDCYLGGGAPHWFRVSLDFRELKDQKLGSQCQLARRVIDLAKPAHTLCELKVSPTMQVGVHSTVGTDTILGG